jgi:MoaA/NifB/PqqE/SkfB family radical SAM enzyme
MKTFADVRHLHLELSSKCNARCPRCPRNYNGFPFNGGYEEANLCLAHFQEIISPEFLLQIEEILINGNYGDFVLNPDSVPIIEYILSSNPKIRLEVSTNGSARDTKFWATLGAMNIGVWFCLDGLADTHSMYRQDTDFDLIIKNAKTFINAGGRAIWKYIVFDYNEHQVQQARQLSRELGFSQFFPINNTRVDGPVYDRQGKKTANTLDNKWSNMPDQLTDKYILSQPVNFWAQTTTTRIDCEAAQQKSMYVGSTGVVTPCCYFDLGQQDQGYGTVPSRDPYLKHLLENENSTVYPERPWFPAIVESWETKQHPICQAVCGKK